MDATIIQLLEKAAQESKHTGRGYCFLDHKMNESWYTFDSVYERALKTAAALAARGIQAKDTVAIVLTTRIEFIDCFLACQMLGAVPVPLYPPVRLGRVEEYFAKTASMLHAVKASMLISDARILRILGPLNELYQLERGMIDVKLLLKDEPQPLQQLAAINPDSLAFIQFSSGTTVDPKPVALTHRQVLANATITVNLVLDVEVDVTRLGVSWLPLYHDMGLIGGFISAIYEAKDIILISPEIFLLKPIIWLQAISKYKATITGAPNFAYALCVEKITDEQLKILDFSHLKIALCGAEPISAEVMRKFNKKFAPCGLVETAITPVYGLAEATLAVSFSDMHAVFKTQLFDRQQLTQGIAKPSANNNGWEVVSVGQAIPGFAIEIRDAHNQVLPAGHEGSIFTRGPSLCNGYYNGLPTPIINGWLKTGDRGFIFENELYITGREKDLIILRGKNHMPHEIERALDDIPGIRPGCAAATSEIGADGEKLIVFSEVRGEISDALKHSCAQAIVSKTGLTPDAIILLKPGTIPRTSSGKIRRSETLKRWRQQQLTTAKNVTPWLLAKIFLRSLKSKVLPNKTKHNTKLGS